MIDLLEIKIAEASSALSKETREAINDVNWRLIIMGMDKKYNPEQLEDLETETELLLCGISSPEVYQQELGKRMNLSKEDILALLNEMDKLIFKKIQEKLEERLLVKGKISPMNTSSSNSSPANKPEEKALVLDPHFAGLPKNVQEAIAKSDWKEKLYEIFKKYQLNIEQMGLLEDITIKLILDEIHPDKYEAELASKMTIPKENISNIVKEVNENILMKIREEEKMIRNEDEIPLPPYIRVEAKKEEPPKAPEQPKSFVVPKPIVENTVVENNIPKNIIEEKLQGATVSDHTVSDYSAPKMSSPTSDTGGNSGDSLSKPHDPYHEPIE